MRVFDVECGGGGADEVGPGAAVAATENDAAHLRHPPFRSGI
jgi:hypothetical protein